MCIISSAVLKKKLQKEQIYFVKIAALLDGNKYEILKQI